MFKILGLLLFFCLNLEAKNSPNPAKGDEHLIRSLCQNPSDCLLKKALAFEKEYRERSAKELEQLWTIALQKTKGKKHSLLKNKILTTMSKEIEYLKEFKIACKEITATIPTRTNKMVQLYEGADDDGIVFPNEGALWLVQNHLDNLLMAKLPEGWVNDSSKITVIDAEDSMFGSSRVSALKIALIHIIIAVDPDYRKEILSWVTESASLHSSPLPPNFPANHVSKKSIWIKGSQLYFIHNGYSFGGNRVPGEPLLQSNFRFDILYPKKRYAPRDCSDWAGEIVGMKNVNAFSTRALPNSSFFEERMIQNPINDIQQGDFLTVGHHHVAIIVGTYLKEGRTVIVTLGYRRNIPNEEGLGIRCFWYETEDKYDRSRIYKRVKKTSN